MLLQESVRELYISLVSDPNDDGLKYARGEDGKIIISYYTLRSLLPPQLKKMSRCYKVMCGCECCIYAKSIHPSLLSWRDRYLKKSKIKAKMLNAEGLVRKHIIYMKHIKIQWCHMGVICMPKHLIYQRLKCAYILGLIMYFHTGNVYCGTVLTVHLSINLTKIQLNNMTKQHPKLGFTFIISLEVVLLMV